MRNVPWFLSEYETNSLANNSMAVHKTQQSSRLDVPFSLYSDSVKSPSSALFLSLSK